MTIAVCVVVSVRMFKHLDWVVKPDSYNRRSRQRAIQNEVVTYAAAIVNIDTHATFDPGWLTGPIAYLRYPGGLGVSILGLWGPSTYVYQKFGKGPAVPFQGPPDPLPNKPYIRIPYVLYSGYITGEHNYTFVNGNGVQNLLRVITQTGCGTVRNKPPDPLAGLTEREWTPWKSRKKIKRYGRTVVSK